MTGPQIFLVYMSIGFIVTPFAMHGVEKSFPATNRQMSAEMAEVRRDGDWALWTIGCVIQILTVALPAVFWPMLALGWGMGIDVTDKESDDGSD